ncbi:hypothetical protein EAI_10440 [Harpegnathos saltator]|uniref:Uncharacterized protein n=1 Tax=Harpegnathos saltator TaxID=610380 RepID=E2C577_HARSA|nr:hypothetical protein EAI_10440 [Harpegnathos saltator]
MSTTKSDISIDEGTYVGWIKSAVDRAARTWIGLIVLKQMDTFLWIVEKSMEWSLPRNEDISENEESRRADLVRPMPWPLFLPTLLFLRVIRASLNAGAFMLGLPLVSSVSMVRFVQRSRYRLASVRQGNRSRPSEKMRLKRDAQDKRLSMYQAKKALIRSIRLTLSTLSCLDGSKPSLSPPPTRIHISALDLDAATITGGKSATESAMSPVLEEKQREEPTSATKSDITETETETETEAELGRNEQLVDTSHDVTMSDRTTTRGEESGTEQSYDEQNEDEQSDEEGSDDDEEEQEGESDSERHGEKGKGEEKASKVESDKAECDLQAEQTGNSNTENNSPEKTPALSQDSDTHFFSPVESSASRSRSSSDSRDSSISNGTPRRPGGGSSSNMSVQNRKIDVTKNRSPRDSTGRSFEETNNGAVMGKRGTNATKYHHHHHRGKRTSHGNRKKK